MDDGVVAGPRCAINHVLSIIQDQGPTLGLFINTAKCKIFSPNDISQFPSAIKRSSVPNMEILGAPIGDKEFCSDFVAQKRANASKLLAQIEQVGSTDLQVALLLLRLCGGFCKLVHISRSTPPSLISDALSVFDVDVCHCFTESTAIDTSQSAGSKHN